MQLLLPLADRIAKRYGSHLIEVLTFVDVTIFQRLIYMKHHSIGMMLLYLEHLVTTALIVRKLTASNVQRLVDKMAECS